MSRSPKYPFHGLSSPLPCSYIKQRINLPQPPLSPSHSSLSKSSFNPHVFVVRTAVFGTEKSSV